MRSTCATCVSCRIVKMSRLRASDNVTQQQDAGRFCHLQHPATSLLIAKSKHIQPRSGTKMAGVRETVAAASECCGRFGGFSANGLYCVTLNGSDCIIVEADLLDLHITIPMKWKTRIPALAGCQRKWWSRRGNS